MHILRHLRNLPLGGLQRATPFPSSPFRFRDISQQRVFKGIAEILSEFNISSGRVWQGIVHLEYAIGHDAEEEQVEPGDTNCWLRCLVGKYRGYNPEKYCEILPKIRCVDTRTLRIGYTSRIRVPYNEYMLR